MPIRVDVKRIGSKKYPILPNNLPVVFGIPIDKDSFI